MLLALASASAFELMAVLVVGGAVLGLSLTRHGTRGRTVVQIFTGLVAVALALAALATLGFSVAVAVQITRGHDNGFGGLAIMLGIPLGVGLGLASLWMASLALGGKRRRTRGADGLTTQEPPLFP